MACRTGRYSTQRHGNGEIIQQTGPPRSHGDTGRDHTPGQGQSDLKVHQGERGGVRKHQQQDSKGWGGEFGMVKVWDALLVWEVWLPLQAKQCYNKFLHLTETMA